MENPEESPAQRAARLRRERREAKFQQEGASRLDKISKLSGRQHVEHAPIPLERNASRSMSPAIPASNDPEEVDLSTQLAALRAHRLAREDQNSFGGASSGERVQEDPMANMLQQMLGAGDTNGMPQGLSSLLDTMQADPPRRPNNYQASWKIAHALFATAVAFYVSALTSVLIGPLDRSLGAPSGAAQSSSNLFWIFTTGELILQSTRFQVERGRQADHIDGWKGLLMGVLPEPYRNYVLLLSRYSRIWTTFFEDAMMVIFIVGMVVWWKGATP